MIDLSGLNKEQYKAVTTLKGPLLVLAGAGSGKTRVITYRIAYMIEKGINPFDILAVTFTNKAAKEMKERLVSLLGNKLVSSLTVSTFHSLGVKILREDGEKLKIRKNFVIYADSDVERLIKEILSEKYKMEKVDPKVIRNIKSIISEAKTNGITPEIFPDNGISEEMILARKVYEHYEEYMRIFNAVDFSDLILKPVLLFENFKDIREKYRKRYNYIMIDEYQDTNDLQFKFINHILNKNRNICVVGDDDQSIYGFRGANVGNILQFTKQFTNAQEIKLEQNYRSTKNIIKAANFVISKNSLRNRKRLYSNLERGEKIKLYLFEDEEHQAEGIASKIKSYMRKNIKPKDIAVMYRSNHQSRIIEMKFKEFDIPYKVVGALDFYNRKEIKDFISYLMVLVFPGDEIHLKRIINYPSRGIGTKSIKKITDYANANKKTFFNALREIDKIGVSAKAKEGVRSFLRLTDKYHKILSENFSGKSLYSFIEEIGLISQIVAETKTEEAAVKKKKNLVSFVEGVVKYIEKSQISLEEYLVKFVLEPDAVKSDEEKDEVTLLSIHASKGLEFPYVFLIGFNDGMLPHQRSLDTKLRKDLEEERRLCYVAITRARKELILSAMDNKVINGNTYPLEFSRFLKDIPDDIMEVVDYAAGESDVPKEEVQGAVMNFLDDFLNNL